jgi:hypothetical protein
MNLGPVDLPADADVTINAKLNADKTPILFAQVK